MPGCNSAWSRKNHSLIVSAAPLFGVFGHHVVDIDNIRHTEKTQRFVIGAEIAEIAAFSHKQDFIAQFKLECAMRHKDDGFSAVGHLSERLH